MFKIFKPKMYYKDIFSVNYELLKEKGIKCLLFDLDNTIEPIIIPLPDDEDIAFFNKLKGMGFKVIIMSNGYKERVTKFAKKLKVDVIYFSLKPFVKSYLTMMYKYHLKPKEIAAIGDQLVTDIWGANNAKITSIFVDRICDIEKKGTKINRFFEKLILNYFQKHNMFEKGNYYE
ncbi:MAG TPA: YqeG family HAD IIIA-type phosphatase [Bacilli bacterium]|nr:YqeG family HAD IIIA-type phosphatase [Bacilli bacterium]